MSCCHHRDAATVLPHVGPWRAAAHRITVTFATRRAMAVLQTEPKARKNKNKNKKERKTVTYHRCCVSCRGALLTVLSPSQCCLLCGGRADAATLLPWYRGSLHMATAAGVTVAPPLVLVCPRGMAG